jgi:hypothetical protein
MVDTEYFSRKAGKANPLPTSPILKNKNGGGEVLHPVKNKNGGGAVYFKIEYGEDESVAFPNSCFY